MCKILIPTKYLRAMSLICAEVGASSKYGFVQIKFTEDFIFLSAMNGEVAGMVAATKNRLLAGFNFDYRD